MTENNSCEGCSQCKDTIAKTTGQRCSEFPYCPASSSELAARMKLPRRAVQRAIQNDAQRFATVDPAILAEFGYFDEI